MISITKSLFCLLTVSATLAAQGDAVDLRIQPKKGATVWLSKHEKQENLIDFGGQSMEQAQDVTTVLQITVKDVDDQGHLVVETKVARIHGSMTIPMMGDVDFDSAAPAEEAGDDDDGGGFGMPSPGALAKSQTAMAGKSFVAKVGPNGKVASLEGVAELLKSGKGMQGDGITEDSLRTLVETAFGPVPEKAVAVGETWDRKLHEDSGQPAVAMKLTLAKVDDAAYEITAEGTIEGPKPGQGGDDPRARMMESLKIGKSKATGKQRVSRQDGFVIEATTDVAMDATMDAGMGEASMTMKVTTRVQRTTAEAAMPKAKAEAGK